LKLHPHGPSEGCAQPLNRQHSQKKLLICRYRPVGESKMKERKHVLFARTPLGNLQTPDRFDVWSRVPTMRSRG